MQSLHWIIEEAAQSRAALYLIYIDFENAFNSVDHAAIWRWLAELNVPDVGMLRALYEGAHYEADLPYGRSAPVFLTRGTKQGDTLSPLLFNLIFNALLVGLRQSGVGFRTVRGLRAPGRGFADDLTLSTATPAGMQRLLDVTAKFCAWTGMRVKLSKSVITAYDFSQRADLPTDEIRFNGEALVCLPAHQSFRYLGVRTSLTTGRKRSGQGPGTAEEVQHVLRSTRELKRQLASHQMPLSLMVPSMRMVAAARFQYSAALVPWTDAQLEEVFKVWMQVEKAAWRLQASSPSALFRLPPDSAGSPLEHPRVVLIQALSTHVRQLVALADDLRESTIRRYRKLCSSCGCLNERELARHLATETQPRRCPIARLLRACGQLGVDIKLPDCLATGKAAREVSWYAMREHIRSRIAPEDELGKKEFACLVTHWQAILKRLRGRGIHFPRQLLLDRNAEPTTWLLPHQMSRNPGWLSPLRRLLERVQAKSLFPRLDRGQGAAETPAHQELMSQLLRALNNTVGQHAAHLVCEVFADDRWTQVRSSAPMLSWVTALQQEGISMRAAEGDNRRSSVIVDMFRNLGMSGHSGPSLHRLCLWLAPTLYTVSQGEGRADNIFKENNPLSREHVSFVTDVSERDCAVQHIGSYTLVTKNGVTRVDDVAGRHIGTVNQGRWGLLTTVYDPEYMIRALPQWIAQTQKEEHSRGVPSLQLWRGICRAFQADVIVGCNPLVAPACFRSALCGRKGEGWGHMEAKARPVYNLMCMSDRELFVILDRLTRDKPWLALTRKKTLSAEAAGRLARIGTELFVWRKGSVVAASMGNWRKAQVRSVQSKEDWTLWSSSVSAETEGAQLKLALQRIVLTRDGTIPLDLSCPSFREAQLGPAGSALKYSGLIVATDGAVKEDGRMGCSVVWLGNAMPPRSFIVFGPPSAMRAELSGMDQAIADAPIDKDLTILTDSLASMQKLEALQRKDFPEWLHGHPERALLDSVVSRVNERASARVLTRFVKVPAHKAHPLNEAADAAASLAALSGDVEDSVMSHADSGAVRFYLSGRLTEWGMNVRKYLMHVAAKQYQDQLSLLLSRQVDTGGTDMAPASARKPHLSLTARWMMRPDQGREYLGAAMAAMRNGAQKRRLMQTVAGLFPCRALLFKQDKAPSPLCLLCGGQSETVAHIQCWCPVLKEARIAAHHAIAALIFDTLCRHSVGRWQFLVETQVSSLRAAEVPLDMYDPWNRMLDELEEVELGADVLGGRQVLARLRPDAWAISWSRRQILLLELTRAHDWSPDWFQTTDLSKIQRYEPLREKMQGLLPTGWIVETAPLTVGIRGSLHEPAWIRLLDRFGVSTRDTQVRFLQGLTRQVLEELDKLYGVRSQALRQARHA